MHCHQWRAPIWCRRQPAAAVPVRQLSTSLYLVPAHEHPQTYTSNIVVASMWCASNKAPAIMPKEGYAGGMQIQFDRSGNEESSKSNIAMHCNALDRR